MVNACRTKCATGCVKIERHASRPRRPRFAAKRTLEVQHEVATLCAPPAVWRMLVLESLGERPARLRELASAGEPLNPEVIETVRVAWGITIRDGYGQTETTAQIGNPPGLDVRPGSMGRPLPGRRGAPRRGRVHALRRSW
jgi:acetyl-CoA synthetase